MNRISKLLMTVVSILLLTFGISSAAHAADTPDGPIVDKVAAFSSDQEDQLLEQISANYPRYSISFIVEAAPSQPGVPIQTAAVKAGEDLLTPVQNEVFIYLNPETSESWVVLGPLVSRYVSEAQVQELVTTVINPNLENGLNADAVQQAMTVVGNLYFVANGASQGDPQVPVAQDNTGSSDSASSVVGFIFGIGIVLVVIFVIGAIIIGVVTLLKKGDQAREAAQAILVQERSQKMNKVVEELTKDRYRIKNFLKADSDEARMSIIRQIDSSVATEDVKWYQDITNVIAFQKKKELVTKNSGAADLPLESVPAKESLANVLAKYEEKITSLPILPSHSAPDVATSKINEITSTLLKMAEVKDSTSTPIHSSFSTMADSIDKAIAPTSDSVSSTKPAAVENDDDDVLPPFDFSAFGKSFAPKSDNPTK